MNKNIKIETSGANSPGYVGGNYTQYNLTIKDRLLFYDNFRKLITSIKTILKHYSAKPINDFSLLSELYFSGKVTKGQQITLTAFLSKYLLIHRPNFYIPFVQKAGDTVLNGPQVKMTIESHLNQLPVQRFPIFSIGGQKIFIYFLYPPDFKGFILEESKEKRQIEEDKVDDILDITYLVQPIFLISPISLDDKTEQIVKLTGPLNVLDESISEIFYTNLSKTQREILYNTFRPYEESVLSLCVDLRQKERCKLEICAQDRKSCSAVLYVETHFENFEKVPKYEQLAGSLMPQNYPGLHWVSFNNTTNISCGLANTDVYILTKEFKEFAFYILTDINDREIYQKKLSELQAFINGYRKRLQNFIRSTYGIEIKNQFDFLFDFSKAKLFHPKGVLVSKYIDELLINTNFSSTIEWLRNIK